MKLFSILAGLVLSLSAFAGQPEISVTSDSVKTQDYLSLNFGVVWVNNRVVEYFTVRNTGTLPLNFRDAYVSGHDFSASHSCRAGLLPNQTCQFSIAYWPMFEGFSSGRFELNFVEDRVVVDLWGQARRM